MNRYEKQGWSEGNKCKIFTRASMRFLGSLSDFGFSWEPAATAKYVTIPDSFISFKFYKNVFIKYNNYTIIY